MYTLFIYNNESYRLERYKLEAYKNMPYTSHNSMSVSDFFSHTISSVGWTSTEFLYKWNTFSKGKIHAKSVFRRIFEGGHIAESMHYAGLAADVTHIPKHCTFPFTEDNHVALSAAGFPELTLGSIGTYVLVLQDALSTLGFSEGELDGFFGPQTAKALSKFKNAYKLPSNSTCDRTAWRTLCFLAAGAGATKTVTHIKSTCIPDKIIL